MKGADLRAVLDRMETLPVPEPDPAFVARLEARLRDMGQMPEAEERRVPAAPRRRARLLVAAGPVAALTAAAAAAAVTLLPADHHPRRVDTADPGVTTPAPEVPTTEQPGPTATSVVVPPPWLPSTANPAPSAPPTTTVKHIGGAPPVTSRVEHPTPTTPPPASQPTSPTTAVAPTTTTVPPAPEALTINCAAGTSGGSAVVGCHWSQSTSAGFKWYRLWRESQGSPPAIVYQTDNRSTTGYYDTSVQAGTGYGFMVDVIDAAGNVIAKSSVATVSCC